jgi:hypothetical protein
MCSAKARGVTTTAVATAACWPETRPRPVVLEADPAGGDVALRAGLAPRPGVLDAAAAAPAGTRPGGLRSWAQRLPCGVDVVAGPATRRQATAATAVLAAAPALVTGGVAPDDVIVADVGRLQEPSPAAGLIDHATALVMLCAPELASLAHTAGVIADLRRQGSIRPVWLVLTGSGPYTDPVEVARAVGDTPVLGVLPDDPRGAAAVLDRSARQLRRTRLGRAVQPVARQLAARLATQLPPAPPLPSAKPPGPLSTWPDATVSPPGTSSLGGWTRPPGPDVARRFPDVWPPEPPR